MTARPMWNIDDIRHTINATKAIHTGMSAAIRTVDYIYGYGPAHFPVPALLVDSVSDLSARWAQWLDTMAKQGKRI